MRKSRNNEADRKFHAEILKQRILELKNEGLPVPTFLLEITANDFKRGFHSKNNFLQKREKYIRLRFENNYSYEDISLTLGVSKQYAHHVIKEFMSILSTLPVKRRLMTTGEVEKYLAYLKETYPLDTKVVIELTLWESKLKCADSGREMRGGVTIKDNTARINVSLLYDDIFVYRTIAHEYRHVMQAFNMGWTTDHCSGAKEDDAHTFGRHVSRKYVYGSC